MSVRGAQTDGLPDEHTGAWAGGLPSGRQGGWAASPVVRNRHGHVSSREQGQHMGMRTRRRLASLASARGAGGALQHDDVLMN